MLKLRSQREDLYKQLKINRDLIDKALNEFEADTKCGLENNFEKVEYNTGNHVSRRNIQIICPDVGCTLFVLFSGSALTIRIFLWKPQSAFLLP
jgi:hypothetical protein